jgi:hypothetical protein
MSSKIEQLFPQLTTRGLEASQVRGPFLFCLLRCHFVFVTYDVILCVCVSFINNKKIREKSHLADMSTRKEEKTYMVGTY